MKTVTLNCWEHFRCIADRCRHSCCVGWEIDVDEYALRRYATVEGEFGQRLRQSIAVGDEGAFFALQGEEERCPFLNEQGLCDMILTLGEDWLCDICTDHPRYRNYFSHREELGFGLCCEEAARELLTFPGKLELIVTEDDGGDEEPTEWERELLAVREELFALAQDRTKSVYARSEALLTAAGASLPEKTWAEWSNFFRGLERLDGEWDRELTALAGAPTGEQPLPTPELPLEQLLIELFYRHLAGAENPAELRERCAFAVLSFRLIYALCAARESCTVEELTELARLFSGEIEYSDENLPALLTVLEQE